MQDIRFNPVATPPEPPKETGEVKKEPKIKAKLPFKKIVRLILIVLFLVILAVGIRYVIGNLPSGGTDLTRKADPSASSYYAIFLSDGQIYFGEIIENNENEMAISNAYRMQPSGQTYSLLKLTDEAYGPTNKIFVNRSHVLFYEQLRKDSRVVELINQQK